MIVIIDVFRKNRFDITDVQIVDKNGFFIPTLFYINSGQELEITGAFTFFYIFYQLNHFSLFLLKVLDSANDQL